MRATIFNYIAIVTAIITALAFALVNVKMAEAQVVNLGTCWRGANCTQPDHSETGAVNAAKVFSNPCASFRALVTGGKLSADCGTCPCANSQPAQTGDACFNGVKRWCPN